MAASRCRLPLLKSGGKYSNEYSFFLTENWRVAQRALLLFAPIRGLFTFGLTFHQTVPLLRQLTLGLMFCRSFIKNT